MDITDASNRDGKSTLLIDGGSVSTYVEPDMVIEYTVAVSGKDTEARVFSSVSVTFPTEVALLTTIEVTLETSAKIRDVRLQHFRISIGQ